MKGFLCATAVAISLAFATPAWAATPGGVVQNEQHYDRMSPGCDIGFVHQQGDGALNKPKFALYTTGTCTSTDSDALQACAASMPIFVADDPSPYMDAAKACPLGDDQDANGFDAFYTEVYDNYVMSLQGF